jgi:hypothetical protein
MTLRIIIMALLATLATPLGAQEPAKPLPCSGPEHRQFDFWLGKWEVTAKDKVVGTSSITSILNGCVIMEEWQSQGAFAGKSFNRYDPANDVWEQLWVDNQGGVLKLAGGYGDGKMVMEQTSTPTDSTTLIDRITWYNNDDGTVRQVWEKSSDGVNWDIAFDGLYRKK